jgi:hypothetical protein
MKESERKGEREGEGERERGRGRKGERESYRSMQEFLGQFVTV